MVLLHPYAHLTPICGGYRNLHVGSDGGHNQTCQISYESVQGSEAPGAEFVHTPLTWHIALTTVYALMYNIVKTLTKCVFNVSSFFWTSAC